MTRRPSPAQPGPHARRGTLAQRIALLAAAIAVITALLAGVLATGLIRSENDRSARRTLARLANAAQSTADRGGNPAAGQLRARNTLLALKVQSASIAADGTVTGTNALARNALRPGDVDRLLAGGSLSAQRIVNSQRVLIEARGTRAGAIALVQRRADATAVGDQAIRRILLALLVGVAIAVALGLLVAYRIARPLRRTAEAAHALAQGRRDVLVRLDGPAEVAEVGRAVNVLAAALTNSEVRQRDFLLSVSHDLRTPLTAIIGYAESLADGVVPPEQAAEVGTIMLAESKRLNRLVADLLDLARLDAQEFRIDLLDVDLAEVSSAAAQVWATRCAKAGVGFRYEGPAARLSTLTDPSRVRQVLDGLLENALRVTPAGSPIVLAVRDEQGPDGRRWAVAEVRDAGPGLTEQDVAVAFERSVLYERYRGVRQVGTGLGLAIVHGLVTRLGGTVEAGRAAEGGARFTVWLPASDGSGSTQPDRWAQHSRIPDQGKQVRS